MYVQKETSIREKRPLFMKKDLFKRRVLTNRDFSTREKTAMLVSMCEKQPALHKRPLMTKRDLCWWKEPSIRKKKDLLVKKETPHDEKRPLMVERDIYS